MKILYALIFFILISICGKSQLITLEQKINQQLSQMSLLEKVLQLSPLDVMNTADNPRLGIPGLYPSDGPHGYRWTESTPSTTYPVPAEAEATSFPVGVAVAATWDPDLAYRMALAMGKEFCAKEINMALSPALYLCNDPRNGRSTESYGEDPYLCAKIGAATVNGLQTNPLLCSIKSFVCENAQNTRMTDTMTISRRMLMEHWGWPFRECVQNANALNTMSAYIAVNGFSASHSHELNKTILRDYWGFPYFIVSDWGSVHDAKAAIESGLDVCMGSTHYNYDLYSLLYNGNINIAAIDSAVKNVLRAKYISGMLDWQPKLDTTAIGGTESNQINYEAGLKSLVLLKNQENILPINQNTVTKVALIGPNAANVQLDGFGSSFVFPKYAVAPITPILNRLSWSKLSYARGCDINSDDTSGFAEAIAAATEADVVIYIGGLDFYQEGETSDRKNGSTEVPGQQQLLINRIAEVNPNVVAVMVSGGMVSLSQCISNIKGLLYCFYNGQEQGNTIDQVLFGDYNPGGKLPVTMPKNNAQLPISNTNFNDDWGGGYRWFDKNSLTPEFAFGHGLSYTTFSYSNIQINNNTFNVGEPINISVDITNSGSRSGEEVPQLYLEQLNPSIPMPIKQLKGFQRIALNTGQTKTVTFTINPEDLYIYDESISSYKVPTGNFIAHIGTASDNLPLNVTFQINSAQLKPDLRVSKILWYPPYPHIGDTVIFITNLKNEGTGESNNNYKIKINVNNQDIAYVDTTCLIYTGGMRMLSASKGVLGKNYWIPTTAGNFTITATVDSDLLISETNENNNTTTANIYVYDSVQNPLEVNLALKKPVAFSSELDTINKAEYAVDGLIKSGWKSKKSDNQYFIVDLKENYTLNKIVLKWGASFATQYEILTSSDTLLGWNNFATISNGNGKKDEFYITTDARYIKLHCTQRSDTNAYSLYELQAYGEALDIGIKNLEKSQDIICYPNPAHTYCNVDFVMSHNENVDFYLYNLKGDFVKSETNVPVCIGKNNFYFDLENVAKGSYFLILQTKELNLIQKLIVE